MRSEGAPNGAQEMREFLALIEFELPGILGLDNGTSINMYLKELCILIEESNTMELNVHEEEFVRGGKVDELVGKEYGGNGRGGDGNWVGIGLAIIGLGIVVGIVLLRGRSNKK